MDFLFQLFDDNRPLLLVVQALSSIINLFGWLVTAVVVSLAVMRGRVAHVQAFGMKFALRQEVVAIASRAERAREQRALGPRQPGQRASSPVVDIEALRAIVDRAFVPSVADRLAGKAILWADDNPRNNVYEIDALNRMGMVIEPVVSTAAALEALSRQPYDLVISDMGRGSEARAGYDLLKAMRDKGDMTPYLLFTAGGSDPAHVADAVQRGAQGSTQHASELLSEVVTLLGEKT